MKLINSSVEIWEQEPGIEGILKQIERCGRVCYKSEDKITESSAQKFVEMLIIRTDSSAHPDMQPLAKQLKEKFKQYENT